MNFILMPSLEHMTVVKIAIALWNQDDVQSLMANFDVPPIYLKERRGEWQDIENKVIEKVQQISLPGRLKEKILCVVKPVGLEILKFKECMNDQNHYSGIDLANALCWTPQGTVNKKSSAKALINDEILDIKSRYRLACIYCFEDDIYKLWHEIPENKRNYAYCIGVRRKRVWQDDLIVAWTDYLEAGEKWTPFRSWDSLDSPDQKAFYYAAVNGNISAIEYFWQKLTPTERNETLGKFAEYIPKENHCFFSRSCTEDFDVLCFLLSQMNEEQLFDAFKSSANEVLACLLHWPYQSFFMGTANLMWELLPREDYFSVLYLMVIRRAAGHKDCDYQKLFREFWMQSPNTHKRFVIDCCTGGHLIPKLLKIADKESIKLILSEATCEEKESMMFSCNLGIFASLMCDEKWDLLKFFILECISSGDVMMKFNKVFKDYIRRHPSGAKLRKERNMRNKFFQFMTNLIHHSKQKRSTDEGGNSSAKKLHHTEFKGSNA